MEHLVVALACRPGLICLCCCEASNRAKSAPYWATQNKSKTSTDEPTCYVADQVQRLSSSDRNETASRLIIT